MAGTGWNDSDKGAGIVVSVDGQTITRPTDGGGATEVMVRGVAGRKKGVRYFEQTISDYDAVIWQGVSDGESALTAKLGSESAQFGWLGFDGLVDWVTDLSSNEGDVVSGTGRSGITVVGFLVNFIEKNVGIYEDGELVHTESFPIGTDLVLYPAASIGVGKQISLQTEEPFTYPPEVTYYSWDRPDAAVSSKVGGTVLIDDLPVRRLLKAFSFDRIVHSIDGEIITESKSLGQTWSDASSGDYLILLRKGYPLPVFVVAFDDYGGSFIPNASVLLGDRIHPTAPNGLVYVCTGSGTLASTEPSWPTDLEGSFLVGTASFVPAPFYRPMVHGPVTPEAAITPPTDGLVAHYSMEAAPSLVMADETGNYNGTFIGGSFVEGEIGNAAKFTNATDQGISSDVMKGRATSFSISIWFDISFRVNNYDSIFMHNPASNTNRIRLFDFNGSGNSLTFNIKSGTINAPMPTSKTHAVGSYDRATGDIKFYINNILVGEANGGSGLTLDSSGPTLIGKTPSWYTQNGNQGVNGWVDECRVYDRVLTPDEVSILYYEKLG